MCVTHSVNQYVEFLLFCTSNWNKQQQQKQQSWHLWLNHETKQKRNSKKNDDNKQSGYMCSSSIQFQGYNTHIYTIQQEKEKIKLLLTCFLSLNIQFYSVWNGVFLVYIYSRIIIHNFFSALFPLPDPWIFYLLIYYHQIILYPIYNLLTLMVWFSGWIREFNILFLTLCFVKSIDLCIDGFFLWIVEKTVGNPAWLIRIFFFIFCLANTSRMIHIE